MIFSFYTTLSNTEGRNTEASTLFTTSNESKQLNKRGFLMFLEEKATSTFNGKKITACDVSPPRAERTSPGRSLIREL